MNEDQQYDQAAPATDSLEDAKRQAMEALTPLLAELEVGPERKFALSMSAIRLTNNKDLVQGALQAALAIPENGPKAEALLELVTEIDYLQKV
jgi:hypothetical protein